MNKNMNVNDSYREEVMNALEQDSPQALVDLMVKSREEVLNEMKRLVEQGVDIHNEDAMVARGYPRLTSEEKTFYNEVVVERKFVDGKAEKLMPETIFERAFDRIINTSELLKRIDYFKAMAGVTKVPVIKKGARIAEWGKITDPITPQLDFSFEVMDVTVGKLKAFLIVPTDLLRKEVGLHFLDNYIVRYMTFAFQKGMEKGVIEGTGYNGQPIGLIRDLDKARTTDYLEKDKVTLKGLDMVTLATEVDNKLNVDDEPAGPITIIVNRADYNKKWKPGMSFQSPNDGHYELILPIDAEVITSEFVDENTAIAARLDKYHVGISMRLTISKSDEYRFLEEDVTFKGITFANGFPEDNHTAIVYDTTSMKDYTPTV